MKAFPALRALACASLLSVIGVTTTSAQLFYHVVDVDSAHVDSNNNLGVAVDIWFNFNPFGSAAGTLEVIIYNRAGTLKNAGEGGGFYTTGNLTGFGFDLPGIAPNFDVPVMTYKAGTFENFATNDLDGVNFSPTIPFDETHPQGTFDFGAVPNTPNPAENALGAGATATFRMQFEGTMGSFSPEAFFANNGWDADFGFRFQSIPGNIGSDKFVYYDNPIPEPSTYGLVAASLLVGLVSITRWRSRKTGIAA